MNEVRFRLRILLIVLGITLLLGITGSMVLEGYSFLDAVYYTVVTVATVGYGDLHPVTDAGKMLAVVLIVSGVGTFVGVFANATELLLARRQERLRQERLHMVVGLFMSEIGTDLLRLLSAADPDVVAVRRDMEVAQGWTDRDFARACEGLANHGYRIDPARVPLERLRDFLGKKRDLLLQLLENPNLLEHESFTDLLRAVFHVKEELLSRPSLDGLPESDLTHLANDLKRAYPLLVDQWVEHLQYLKANYSFLFSLAVRTNPFREDASPVVR